MSKNGKVRFLSFMTGWTTLRVPSGNGSVVTGVEHEKTRALASARQGEACLEHERREQTRYGVKALVNFEWVDEGVVRRGQGVTRDISPKGMFIYSDTKPPAKADLHLDVSFQDITFMP